ncbi:MAG: hypothetical protein R3F33_14865 [Planctomycetota bacterium]
MARLPARLAALACVLLAVFYLRTQDRVEYYGGCPYDAAYYHQQARLVSLDRRMSNWEPFGYRLGAPWVVGRFYPPAAEWLSESAPGLKRTLAAIGPAAGADLDAKDLLDGFTWLSALSGIACVALLVAVLRQYGAHPAVAWWMATLFVANPYSPFRFGLFYPAMTDNLAMVAMLLVLYGYARWPELRPVPAAFLGLAVFVGGLVREVILLLPLVFAWSLLWRRFFPGRGETPRWRTLITATLLVTTGLLALWCTRRWVDPVLPEQLERRYHPVQHAQQILQHNLSLPSIPLVAGFLAIGPLFLVLPFALFRRRMRALLGMHREILLLLPAMVGLAVVGGLHTDRIMYWSLPIMMIPLAWVLQEGLGLPGDKRARWILLALLVLAQALAYRAFLPIPQAYDNTLLFPGTPEHLILSAYGPGTTWGQVTAAAMERPARFVLLWQYIPLAVATFAAQFLFRSPDWRR